MNASISRCRGWGHGATSWSGFWRPMRTKPSRERLTLIRIFEELRDLGYDGSYSSVWRHAQAWEKARGSAAADAYVPLIFAPGEAYQFDWSHEIVVLNGVTTTVKVAHVRLCHSRMLFVQSLSAREPGDGVRRARPGVRLLPRRLHARHLRQHEDGGGDGLRRQGPAVQPPLPADVQPLSRRAGGLHAGVGLGEGSGREPGRTGARALLHAAAALQEPTRSSTPGCSTNALPMPGCIGIPNRASARSGRCSRPSAATSSPMPAASMASIACRPRCRRPAPCASTTTNTRCFPTAVGRPVEIHAYADGSSSARTASIVGEHARSFGRGETVYDPWHYVPVLARKPGALRNGAPFRDWVLPAAMEKVRRRLKSVDDGDRQMVSILACVLTDGLTAVEAACQEALDHGVCVGGGDHQHPCPLPRSGAQRDPFHPRDASADP